MRKRILSLVTAIALLLCAFPAVTAASGDMSFSEEAVRFLKQREGFAAEPYSDSSGWYIGYGCYCDPEDYPDGITEDEADALLRERAAQCEEQVNAFCRRYGAQPEQCEFDALCCMTFAFGSSWLDLSNRLPSYVAEGIENYSEREIVNAFAAWSHIGTEPSEALVRRRIDEARMFLYGDYGEGDSPDWCWLICDPLRGEMEVSDVHCYLKGEPYGELPEASLAGSALTGWKTEGGAILSPDGIAVEDLRVTAVWGEIVPETPDEPPCFPDVSAEDWFYPYVSELTASGVVNGYDDGLFRPRGNVTYGEAYKLILLAAGYSVRDGGSGAHWASAYAKFAESNGLIDGASADLDAKITRLEIAQLVFRALGLEPSDAESPFADASSPELTALYETGIFIGSEESTGRMLKGGDAIIRSEISAVIWRLLKYAEENVIVFFNKPLPVDKSLSPSTLRPDGLRLVNGRFEYDEPYSTGIDVSYYQGNINWQSVAGDGIDYAIIRCGYRGSSKGEIHEDDCFRQNMSGAGGAGLGLGVYFFSQAVNPEEAREEARWVLERIGGYTLDYPIVFDWEQLTGAGSRTRTFNGSTVTACALAFCEEIADAGYTPCVYFNETMAYLHYDLSRLQGLYSWLAHYTDRATDYRYSFDMWQYTSSAPVSGISGRVDMNICFK